MDCPRRRFHGCAPRRIICEHRIEIEVFPESAEVYFANEAYADPAVTQMRFDAVVYNAPTGKVLWSVQDPSGGPGQGSIDGTGLYSAPGAPAVIKRGVTDVIVAAAADNPERRAYAFVTLIGKGPEPKPVKRIRLSPKRSQLYYPDHTHGDNNDYIDGSNTRQIFRAMLSNVDAPDIAWYRNGVLAGSGSDVYCCQINAMDASGAVRIRAQCISDSTVFDEALIAIGNYYWPSIN